MIFGSETASAALDPPGARDRRPARRQRIAGHAEVVDDAAALDVALRSPRSVRIGRAFPEAVVRGIGIDQDAGRAVLLRRQRLEAAIAVRHRVADQHDLAFDVDAVLREPVVVGRVAAAGVDDRRGDVAGRRVGVVAAIPVSRAENGSPSIASSFIVARHRARATIISTCTSVGYGSSTSCSTISTCSRPYSRQRSRTHSASTRSRGEPATCGSAVSSACASRAFAADGSERNRYSRRRSAADERAVKP